MLASSVRHLCVSPKFFGNLEREKRSWLLFTNEQLICQFFFKCHTETETEEESEKFLLAFGQCRDTIKSGSLKKQAKSYAGPGCVYLIY